MLQVRQKQANRIQGQTLLVHDLQIAEDALIMHRALYSNSQSQRGVHAWHPCAQDHMLTVCLSSTNTSIQHSTHMAAQHIVFAQHSTRCLHSIPRSCLQSTNVTQHDVSASTD